MFGFGFQKMERDKAGWMSAPVLPPLRKITCFG